MGSKLSGPSSPNITIYRRLGLSALPTASPSPKKPPFIAPCLSPPPAFHRPLIAGLLSVSIGVNGRMVCMESRTIGCRSVTSAAATAGVRGETLPFHYLSTAFPLPSHCRSLPFYCLSLTFPCLSLTFPCLSLTFPCLSLTFPCLSLIFTAFRRRQGTFPSS